MMRDSRPRPTDAGTEAEGHSTTSLHAEVLVIGGGLGGCAAALAASRHGRRVIMTESTDWIGGQLTSQGVPPDEHPWIEQCGCSRSYRALRNAIRAESRARYPLSASARADKHLNPGQAWVSKLSCEPRVALVALRQLLAPAIASGTLHLLLEHEPVAMTVGAAGDAVTAGTFRRKSDGNRVQIEARFILDATELGDVIDMAGAASVSGAESVAQTGEAHAPAVAAPRNSQAITVCFAVEHRAGEDHTIERPAMYDFWRSYTPSLTPSWPGNLLSWEYTHPITLAAVQPRFVPHDDTMDPTHPNLWSYRRIVSRQVMMQTSDTSDVCLVNWPHNDYWLEDLCLASPGERLAHIEAARQLSLSLLYWLQTEGGLPGLRPRGDVMGTTDGLAKAPYIRESRRILARTTVTEADLSPGGGRERATDFPDSVGVGYYRIDLHPSCGGDNYIDIGALPFQIPLGALVPVRVKNLLPAAKNIGTTHITNGCYRLHPVEWAVGEASGALAAFCLDSSDTPQAVHEDPNKVRRFQQLLREDGVELAWPEHVHMEALKLYLANPMMGDQLREHAAAKL
jgi:hypothetical protein